MPNQWGDEPVTPTPNAWGDLPAPTVQANQWGDLPVTAPQANQWGDLPVTVAPPAPEQGGGFLEDVIRSWRQAAGTIAQSFTRPPEYSRAGVMPAKEAPLPNVETPEMTIAAGRAPVYEAADAVRKDAVTDYPLRPSYENSAAHAVTQAAVTTVPLLATAAVNPYVGAVAGSQYLGQTMRNEAMDAGHPEAADKMEMAGTALGVLGALPFGQLIAGLRAGQPVVTNAVRSLAGTVGENTLEPMIASTMKKAIARGAVNAGATGAVVSGVQTVGANVAARETGVDPERETTQGLLASMATGGIFALMLGGYAGGKGFRNEQKAWENMAAAYASEVPNVEVQEAVAAYGKARTPENLAKVIGAANRTVAKLPPDQVADVVLNVRRKLGIVEAPEPPRPTQPRRNAWGDEAVPPQESEAAPIVPGASTTVFGARATEFPATYAWAPTSKIQASHTGEMMAQNPRYVLTNTRDYSDPSERDKQLAVLQGFDPRRHVTDSPDAAVGPSIVGLVIDEQGNSSLQRFGGNNRGFAIENLPADRRTALQILQNQNAGRFGLQPVSDPDAELVRHLGTFDFRQPGERERAQAIVDALNPSPGMIQGTAKRAEIDAARVPAELLANIPVEVPPAQAQEFVQELITRGLADRNLTAAIAANPSQAQDYTQRVLIQAAFGLPAVAETRHDPRTSATTVRGMIDAAVPALVQMRAQPGGKPLADAVSQAFATALGYLKQPNTTLTMALDRAARQSEIDPNHQAAQAIAAAMQKALVLNKAGRSKPEESIANLQRLFGRIAQAVARHEETENLWGDRESLTEVVKRALSYHESQASVDARTLGMPEGNVFGTPAEVIRNATRANGTIILNADDMVSPHLQGLPFVQAQQLYTTLQPEAAAARNAAFQEALKRPARPGEYVVLSAGGMASGKSTAVPNNRPGVLVLDTVLGNATHARKLIESIRKSGRNTLIQFVYRAFPDAVRGNLSRAMTANRMGTARGLAKSHYDARNAIEEILANDRFSGDVRVQIVVNREGAGLQTITPDALFALPKPSLDQLIQQAHDIANGIYTATDPAWAGPALPDDIYRTFRGLAGKGGAGHPGHGGESQRGNRGGEAPGRAAQSNSPGPLGDPALELPGRPSRPLKVEMEGTGNVSIPQIMASYEAVITAMGGKTPLRVGRFFQRARGIFKPKEDVARINNAGNLSTAAHEIAHALQQDVFGNANSGILLQKLPIPVAQELMKLGRALYGPKRPHNGYESEGWAEYWRLYLTDDSAPQQAPQMTQWVEQWLAQQTPQLRAAIQQAKAQTDLWRSQGAMNRARAQMPAGPSRWQRLKATTGKLFTTENWLEEFKPLRELAQEHERLTGKPLKPSANPYELASARRGTSGTVTLQMVMHGMIDLTGNLRTDSTGRYVGSLAEIVQPLRGLEDEFAVYLWANRALELHARQLDPGMSLQDAQYLSQQLGALHPDFGPASQRLYAWQDSVLEYLLEANPALSDSIMRMRSMNQAYVPLGRVMESAGASAGARTLAANPLQRLKGSGRQVKPLFEQIIANTQKLVASAHKAQVLQTMARMSDTPGMGWLIEEVPRDRVKNSVTIEQVKYQLEAMGLDTSLLSGDEQLDYYTLAEQPKGADPIIPVRRGSEVRWFQVAPEMFELLSGLEPVRLGPLADLFLGAPARAFRAGTTGMRASFVLVTNPARDIQTLLMQTMSDANPARVLAAWFGAFKEVITGGPMRQTFHQLAVEAGQPLGMDVQHTAKASRGLFQGPVRQLASSPLEFLRSLLNFMESVPRVAEMKLVAERIGWTPGTPLTPDQAVEIANAGKRVTVDFAAGGRIAKQFNQGIPFFNAAIQGTRTFARVFKERPVAAAIKALAYFIVPALVAWWFNKKEKWYQELPWRERYLYWNMSPDGVNVVQIPRPPEWGALAAIAEGAADSWYRQDPRGASEALSFAGELTMPLDYPVLLKAGKEQWQNRIEFFDKPIIPRDQIDLPPGDQFAPYTSELAKSLGRAFPESISPRRIDAAVRSIGGGVGGDLLGASDRLVQALGLSPAPERSREAELSDTPILGRLFRRGGVSSAQNQAIADFWDDYLHYRARKDSTTSPLDARETLYLERLKNAHEMLKRQEGVAAATPNLRSRQILYSGMAEVARRTLDTKPKPQ